MEDFDIRSSVGNERFSMFLDELEGSSPTIYSWGRSDNYTLFQSENESVDGVFIYKNPNRVILQISSNEYHTAALTSTGDLLICGSNEEGQSGNDYNDLVIKKPRIYELSSNRITSVSVGLYHTACVTSNGIALSFGGNEVGQTGHSSAKMTKVPLSKVDFNLKGLNALIITKAVCGDYFSLFLTTKGEVYACGLGSNLGNPKDTNCSVGERVERLVGSNIMNIAAGSSHSLALTSSGELYAWGSNHHGECGVHDVDHCQTPVLVKLPTHIGKIIGIACGGSHSLAWTDRGILLGTGSNKYGQLGLFQPRVTQFTVIDNIGDNCTVMTSIASTTSTDSSTQVSKKISTDSSGSGSDGTSESASTPLLLERCVQAACGRNHSLVLTITNNSTANTVDQTYALQRRYTTSNSIIPVERQGEHKLYGFGSNTFGQIRSTDTVSLFRQPTELTEFRSVWNVQKILFLAAGGDQTFIAVVPSGVEADTVQQIMKKQFSTLASQSLTPVSASELLSILSEAHSNPRMLNSALLTTSEILSSSSLLAASFKDPLQNLMTTAANKTSTSSTTSIEDPFNTSGDLSVDVAGVEACYISFLGLGNAAVLKTQSAFKTTLTTLEALFDTSSGTNHTTNTSSTSTSTTPTPAAASTASVALSSLVPVNENNIPDSILRILLILWLCPLNINAVVSSDTFPRIIYLLARLSPGLRKKLGELLLSSSFPSHLLVSRILKPVHEHLSLIIETADSHHIDPSLPVYCVILNWLYSLTRGKNIIPPEQFYNSALSKLPDEILVKDFLEWKQFNFNKHQQQSPGATTSSSSSSSLSSQQRFFISNHPYLLSAEAKRRILFAENQLQQQSAQQQLLTAGYLGAIAPIDGVVYIRPWFVLTVNRNNLLQTALVHIAQAPDYELKMPLKVIFEGEEGVDAGGVTKEFFQLIINQLFNPQYGMFTETADGRSLWINRNSGEWNLDEFNLVGVLLGLAVYNGVLLDIHLPKVFFRKLLHRPMTLEDISSIDPELMKGMQQLLNYTPASDVEHIFCRTFQVTWDMYGEEQSVELIPNGKNISVTGENRQLYVNSYIQWLLNDSIKAQFDRVFAGFTKVVHLSSLLLLSPEELELLMVGQPHLDFKELQAHAAYVGDEGWNADHPTVQYFWDYLHNQCSFEMKQKFLLFVTGSSKSPVGGLGKLGLKIQRQGPDSDHLPTAHTCFNTLLLPEYTSLEKLSERLGKAILECEGFGLK